MSFKPFYVHINNGPGPLPSKWARGATVLVSPIDGDARNVHMQVTICSRKDQFNKKEGRSQVATKEKYIVNKRALADKMNGVRYLTWNEEPRNTQSDSYYYIYKYMV